MAITETFTQQIESRLARAKREPNWEPEQSSQFMAELAPRRQRFEEVCPYLVESIIRPYLESFASYFPNSELDRVQRKDRASCWLGYCEEYPATTGIEFRVEHDQEINNLIIRCQVSMMPVFIKFEAHDKLIQPLSQLDEPAIAGWVESKLLGFLDTYLQLDRGADDFDVEVAIDPVCGMRISTAAAKAKASYLGHPYFFCSEECRERFNAAPTKYISFKTD